MLKRGLCLLRRRGFAQRAALTLLGRDHFALTAAMGAGAAAAVVAGHALMAHWIVWIRIHVLASVTVRYWSVIQNATARA